MRIFISGSSDGLGFMAAKALIDRGHEVVLHARSDSRAKETLKKLPKAQGCLIGDFASIETVKSVAAQANELGKFDAVIHNVAVGYQEPHQLTVDKLPHVFAINTLSVFILTAVMTRPDRLIYLSSGLHQSGASELEDLLWEKRRWQGTTAYSESKFHDALLAFAVARLWPEVRSNALEPGWVATKMGGPHAPDDMTKGFETQVWLATSQDAAALQSGEYFFHQRLRAPHSATRDVALQDKLLARCEEISGVKFPRN